MKSKNHEIEGLRKVARLDGLDDKQLRAIADAGTRVHLPANWSLMAETTPADKAYVILSGEVAVRQKGRTVATVGAGNIIGEVGIMERRLRTASVVSLTELDVIHFTNADLARLADQIPAFGEAVHATADEHLGRDDDRHAGHEN